MVEILEKGKYMLDKRKTAVNGKRLTKYQTSDGETKKKELVGHRWTTWLTVRKKTKDQYG